VFFGAWGVAALALLVLGAPIQPVLTIATMVPQPLWFLAVWVALLVFTPALVAAWRRWRWRALIVAAALPLVVDVLRFGFGHEHVAYANILLLWAVPFLAGLAYADERVHGRTGLPARWTLWTGAGVALATMSLLIAVGPYPASMVGMPGAAVSNLCPPTAVILFQSIAQVCLALALRERLVALATGPGHDVVAFLSRRSMTLYLWHLTAMFTVVGVVLLGIGERLPTPWSVDWWLTRPLWFTAFALVLAGLTKVFGRYESRRG
jgi:peptidoglycan/LPS O-acetylase OafA/YrhL